MKVQQIKKNISKIVLGTMACLILLGSKTEMAVRAEEKDAEIANMMTASMCFAENESAELEKINAPIKKVNNIEHEINYSLGEEIPCDGLQYKARTITQNTDSNYAYLVSNDVIMQGAIETESEFRWYAFVLNEKSKVSILLQMEEQLDADLYMFTLNQETSSLELIGGSAIEGLGTQEFFNDVMEAGTYFFSIAGYEGTGDFAFAYYESSEDVENEINDYSDVAAMVEMSTDIVGVIDNPNDWDYYKFTVTEPTILRYSITSTDGYSLSYAGSSSSTPIIIDGTMIKVRPGTYYFAVYSEEGLYSASSSYTVNFKCIGEYADETLVPFRAINEEAGIVFQTNISGTSYYVNGNPIDINYEYHYEDNNSAGNQSYNITLSDIEGVYCQIWDEEVQGPDVLYYHYSTKPNIEVQSKYLLRLMFYAEDSVKFYKIMCQGTGAYAENTLYSNPNYVIVLIDPDTGKLVDIAEFNYFYEHAIGSNSLVTSSRKDMKFNYCLYDYMN